eukprot:1611304-Pyramimonas_sp.AAC.1
MQPCVGGEVLELAAISVPRTRAGAREAGLAQAPRDRESTCRRHTCRIEAIRNPKVGADVPGTN